MKPCPSLVRTRPVRLGRHDIDRVARAVAGGRRGLGARLDAIADAVASRMTAKLAAAGVPTTGDERRRAQIVLDRETRASIVARVSKHLPVVDETRSHGSARAR